ncbi:tRNA pseudouridine(65) synthase TruC [Mariniblastus sp.]|nr:tRNA pseudouridine(65) synthase TruC [Mariniblastus sp.]
MNDSTANDRGSNESGTSEPSSTEQGTSVPLEIVYQDESLVAINKPAGLLVHRSRIDVHATEFALQRLRDQIQQPVFPVHRIDRPTSGVLLFALDRKIAASVAKQFEQRTVEKTYHAIVRGFLAKEGQWDEPLVEKHDRIVDRQARKNKDAQPATTQFRSSKQWEIPFSAGKYPTSRYSLATIRPLTGRKHQIRRHFNHMAHPIIGDTTYGDRRHNRLFIERLCCSRLLLAATKLTLDHPVTQARITITAGLGEAFERVITELDSQYISNGSPSSIESD